MPELQLKVPPPEFIASMKKFMEATKKYAELTNKINSAQTQITQSLAFRAQLTKQADPLRQMVSHMRRMPALFHKFESMLRRSSDNMLRMLGPRIGSFVRQMVMPESIFSGLSSITKLAGTMSAGRFAMLLRSGGGWGALAAAGVMVAKWLWDKSMVLMEAAQKDRIQAILSGTTIGGLRAFRTVFWMLPNDPKFENIMRTMRAMQGSNDAIAVSAILGVKQGQDTVDAMVQTLLRAQAFLRQFPGQELQAVENFRLPISPETTLALGETDPARLRERAERLVIMRRRLNITDRQLDNMQKFLFARNDLLESIYVKFQQIIVDSGMAQALTSLSRFMTQQIDAAKAEAKPSVVRKPKHKQVEVPHLKEFGHWFETEASSILKDITRKFDDLNKKLLEYTNKFKAARRALDGIALFTPAAAAEGHPGRAAFARRLAAAGGRGETRRLGPSTSSEPRGPAPARRLGPTPTPGAFISNVPRGPVPAAGPPEREYDPPTIPLGYGPTIADQLKGSGVNLPPAVDAKIRAGQQLTESDLKSIPKDDLEKANKLVTRMGRPPLYRDVPGKAPTLGPSIHKGGIRRYTGPQAPRIHAAPTPTPQAPAPPPARQAPPRPGAAGIPGAPGTPSGPPAVRGAQAPTTAPGPLQGPNVNATALYNTLKGKFAASPLNGYVPKDGARWGIKTGSPDEWARLGTAVAQQESGLRAAPGNGQGLYQMHAGDLRNHGVPNGNPNNPNDEVQAMVNQWSRYIPKAGVVSSPATGPGTYSGYGGAGAFFGSMRGQRADVDQYLTPGGFADRVQQGAGQTPVTPRVGPIGQVQGFPGTPSGPAPVKPSVVSTGLPGGAVQYPGTGNYYSQTGATRNAQPYQGVVMHVTGKQTVAEEAEFSKGGFGYQYVIDKDGKVYQFGDPSTSRPNQIQATTYRTDRLDLTNKNALGIGFITGGGPPTAKQMEAAHKLVPDVYTRFNIPTQLNGIPNYPLGHGEIQGGDPERSVLGPGKTPEGQVEAKEFRTPESIAGGTTAPMAAGTQRPVMYGFKGIGGKFNEAEFRKYASSHGYEPVVVQNWNKQGAVAEAQADNQRRGGQKFGVYGYSLGAETANMMVGQSGDKVTHATVIAPYHSANLSNINSLPNANVFPDPSSKNSSGRQMHPARGEGFELTGTHPQAQAEANSRLDQTAEGPQPGGQRSTVLGGGTESQDDLVRYHMDQNYPTSDSGSRTGGPEANLRRMAPEYLQRAKEAREELKEAGLGSYGGQQTGPYSTFRDPRLGVNSGRSGWSYRSMHGSGTTSDWSGTPPIGTPAYEKFSRIMEKHGFVNPYPGNAAEWNHWQLSPQKAMTPEQQQIRDEAMKTGDYRPLWKAMGYPAEQAPKATSIPSYPSSYPGISTYRAQHSTESTFAKIKVENRSSKDVTQDGPRHRPVIHHDPAPSQGDGASVQGAGTAL